MTRVALATLGLSLVSFSAAAEVVRAGSEAVAVTQDLSGSVRGVAQNYLVLPEGEAELGAQTRFVTSEALFVDDTGTPRPLAFSDLGLFGLSARKSMTSRLEISAHVELLPKQPSYTHEKVWQSVGGAVRSPIGTTAAVALGGGGGHLLSSDGSWIRQSLTIEVRKHVGPIMTFDVHGGADTTMLLRDGHDGGWLTELGVSTQVLFHDPHGYTGAWVGVGYALPVVQRGNDPTTDVALDPQPRLDFRIGGVLSLVPNWDVYAEFAVGDRGELANAATRLPILDGGFDQRQLMLGVTRHFSAPSSSGSGDDDMPLALR